MAWEPIIVMSTIIDPLKDERRLTVDRWPQETVFDTAVLASADPSVMQVTDDTVSVTVSNGRAVYQLGEWGVTSMSHPAYLISSRLSEETY